MGRKRARETSKQEDVNEDSQPEKETPTQERKKLPKGLTGARIEYFARGETSSTPTGNLKKKHRDEDDEDVWPGPWTTAALILQKRQAFLAKRQEMKDKEEILEDKEQIDRYDSELSTLLDAVMHVSNDRSNNGNTARTASLQDLCCQKIAESIPEYGSEGFGFLSSSHRYRIAEILSQKRLLDPDSALLLASAGATSLDLPDCSNLDEESFLRVFEKLSSSGSCDLQQLSLGNCGRGFTDRVALFLSQRVNNLETLRLEGSYRLCDEGLVPLLQNCAHSLHSLSLSCNSRLSNAALSTILNLSQLRHLKLDYVDHLPARELEDFLLHPKLHLEELFIRGLRQLSPETLVRYLEQSGKGLKGLDLSECQVNDMVIITLRNQCVSLSRLILEQIDDVSKVALVGLFVVEKKSSALVSSDSGTSLGSLGPLSEVSFRGTSNVTDDAIIQLCENYSRTLRRISLHSCSLLTGRSLAALWTHCWANLVEVDFSFLRAITSVMLQRFFERCQKLQKISIWGCTQLSSSQLQPLSAIVPEMEIIGKVTL